MQWFATDLKPKEFFFNDELKKNLKNTEEPQEAFRSDKPDCLLCRRGTLGCQQDGLLWRVYVDGSLGVVGGWEGGGGLIKSDEG